MRKNPFTFQMITFSKRDRDKNRVLCIKPQKSATDICCKCCYGGRTLIRN